MTDRDPRPPRRQVNLRGLPSWAQYVIALTAVAIVVTLAWRTSVDEPTPAWATDILVPALAWVLILALATSIVVKIVRRSGESK